MWNYTVAKVWGIPIRVNVSLLVFLPVLVWLVGSGQQLELYAALVAGMTGKPLPTSALRAGATPWLVGTAAAVGLFASVTLHELGHSWVAMRYGVAIDSITLWIFGGVASLRTVPREWNREFFIAVAGPATSLLVGAACYGLARAVPASLPAVLFVVGWLAVTNVVLAAFNMLPAFPMDGGRVLRALLARSRPYPVATRTAARVGTLFAVAFAVVGVLAPNVVLILVAVFVYGAAVSESRAAVLGELLSGVTAGDLASRGVAPVSPDATVAALLERMFDDRRTAYPVGDGSGVVGVVTLADLRGTDREAFGTTRVSSVMAAEVPRVAATADAFDVLATLGRGSVALVETGAGQVPGILTTEDYARALEFRRETGTV